MFDTLLGNALNFCNHEWNKRGYGACWGETVIVVKLEDGRIAGCISREKHAERVLIEQFLEQNISYGKITDMLLLDVCSRQAIIPCNECIELLFGIGLERTRVWMETETCFELINVRHIISKGKDSLHLIKNATMFPEEYKNEKTEEVEIPQVVQKFQKLEKLIQSNEDKEKYEKIKKQQILKKKNAKNKAKKGWFV